MKQAGARNVEVVDEGRMPPSQCCSVIASTPFLQLPSVRSTPGLEAKFPRDKLLIGKPLRVDPALLSPAQAYA